MHPEFTGLITAARHNPPVRCPPNDHRLPLQFRVYQSFYGDEEGVEVEVDDIADSRHKTIFWAKALIYSFPFTPSLKARVSQKARTTCNCELSQPSGRGTNNVELPRTSGQGTNNVELPRTSGRGLSDNRTLGFSPK